MKCPELYKIIDWMEGRPGIAPKAFPKKHIEACGACSEQVRWLQKATEAIGSRELVEAPGYVVDRALKIFGKRENSLVRMVKAVLTFDSWAQPEAAGTRSVDRSTRQLRYETPDASVFLMLLPATGKESAVLGQVVPLDPERSMKGWEVHLKVRDSVVSRERTNGAGEFYFPVSGRKRAGSAPAGKVDLLIYTDTDPIFLSDITGGRA